MLLDVNLNGVKDTLYVDKGLYRNLSTIVIPALQQQDKDRMEIVDGSEGSGKSVFAMQLGFMVDPSLTLERICFSAEEFVKAVRGAKPFQCVIFDEAFRGLSSRAALDATNRAIITMFMEMRQKNLFVIIVLPTIFLLDRYVTMFRSKGLFHVYTNKGRRGCWRYYNFQKKKELLILGRKMMDYNSVRVGFRGRFTGKYVIDEVAYRQKKKDAFELAPKVRHVDKQMAQRDALLSILVDNQGLTYPKVAKLLNSYGVEASDESLRSLYRDKKVEKQGMKTVNGLDVSEIEDMGEDLDAFEGDVVKKAVVRSPIIY